MSWPTVPPIPDLSPLQTQLADAGFDVSRGLGMNGWPDDPHVFTYDANGQPVDLPPDAQPIIDAFLNPPTQTTTSTSTRSKSSG